MRRKCSACLVVTPSIFAANTEPEPREWRKPGGTLGPPAESTTSRTVAAYVAAAPPPAVRGSATISITIVLLALLVASVAAFLVSSPPPEGRQRMEMEGAGVHGGRSGSEPVEQAVGHGVPGFNSRLDAFRAWAKLAWMKLQRPRSDEPRYDTGGVAGSAAEAAKKSMEMGKETVEQAAATAADAMGMAKDKVKGAAAPSSDAEL